jgi:sec-independent protein translocase protein TatC
MSQPDTFLFHLIELRDRLLRVVLGVIVVFVCLFPFANDIYTLLAHPLLARLPAGGQMIATAVTTPFFVPMKMAMLVAVLVSLPNTLYQAWAFVAPGLYQHEKRFVAPLILLSTLLFFAGMAFAYFLVFPVVFGFIAGTAPEGVAVMTDIGNYLDFVITLFLAFGFAFQVPVIVLLLVKLDMVSVVTLKEIRPYVVVGAFVAGAILTPPDVISQVMLAVPLWLLYEAGIFAAGFLATKSGPT